MERSVIRGSASASGKAGPRFRCALSGLQLVARIKHTRRIYTDGRDWPKEIEPTLVGYSIGQWIDEDNDGRYDVLEVETRGFKGPRHYDAADLPLHHDNQSKNPRRGRGQNWGDLFGPILFQWGRKCGGIDPEASSRRGRRACSIIPRISTLTD